MEELGGIIEELGDMREELGDIMEELGCRMEELASLSISSSLRPSVHFSHTRTAVAASMRVHPRVLTDLRVTSQRYTWRISNWAHF